MNEKDIVKLTFNMKMEREHIKIVLDTLANNIQIKQILDPEQLLNIKLLSLIQLIPKNKTHDAEKLFCFVRKKGYRHKRNKFYEELYYLEAFGVIKTEQKGNRYLITVTTEDIGKILLSVLILLYFVILNGHLLYLYKIEETNATLWFSFVISLTASTILYFLSMEKIWKKKQSQNNSGK